VIFPNYTDIKMIIYNSYKIQIKFIYILLSVSLFTQAKSAGLTNNTLDKKYVAVFTGQSNFQPQADLPPLLEFIDGQKVKTNRQWEERKEEIRKLLMNYFTGTLPEKIPELINTEILEIQKPEDGSKRQRVRITLGTPNRRSFEIWLWLPKGSGPFPLLLTAPRYYQIPWADLALKRGYAVCLYPGVDSHQQEAGYPGYESIWQIFNDEYPEATWTEIITKAWLAGRALDFLLDPDSGYPLKTDQICIIGHSRYGKQSLIAAAIDERITSVVARSPGSPGSCPYRFTSRNTFAEAPEDFPDQWFLPSLRNYTGREHELPIDAHGWYALIAPRHVLIHTAYNDGCEPTFAVERAYLEGQTVYKFLGHPGNLRILYRQGGHNPITEEHRKQNIDWFDFSFGRGTASIEDFPERLLHHCKINNRSQKQKYGDRNIPSPATEFSNRDSIILNIAWMLGEKPQKIEWSGEYTFLTKEESELMTHDRWAIKGVDRLPVSFGENVRGNIYYSKDDNNPRPVIIWLHPFSYHSGYNEGYGVQGTTVYHRLAQAGYIVLAFDQCGFGLRLHEGAGFYEKYPHWSRLGRMIHDVRSAVDFITEEKGEADGTMPFIDKNNIFVLGYSLGGMVGLHAAALDKRITGVACFSGFSPLRTCNNYKKETGGLARFWNWHGLIPKLELFENREGNIPYDYDDLLRLIAPRPCLVVAQQRDRYHPVEEVRNCINEVRSSWMGKSGLRDIYPDDIQRFQSEQHTIFLDWLSRLVQPK
jgi:pimeloyl-ACP methyl ester carboxylesterase